MNTIYRLFILRPKYVIFPPHWSSGSSPAPRGFSFSFPKQYSTTKQLTSQDLGIARQQNTFSPSWHWNTVAKI